MILVVSTSTSLASLALFDEGGREVWGVEREAPRAASQAILEMAEEQGLDLDQVRFFVADGGPGSFTGVKVGVALVKTWAWAKGAKAALAPSFDLARPAVSSLFARKGHIYRRTPEGGFETVGGSPEGPAKVSARHAGALLPFLERQDPAGLTPFYGGLPNVSRAKNPLIMGEPS